MKRLATVAATIAMVLTFTGSASGYADPGVTANLVDGTVTVSDITCSWINASTSDNPPNTLTIDRNTVNPPGGNLTCTGAAGCTLNNDPVVTFNADGTMTIDRIEVSCTASGITCGYEANFVVLYNGSGSFTARKKFGSFLCPATVTGSIELTFH